MDEVTDLPMVPVRSLDRWLTSFRPSVDDVAARVSALRRLAADAQIAEAHMVNYVREVLEVPEFADDPDLLDPGRHLADV